MVAKRLEDLLAEQRAKALRLQDRVRGQQCSGQQPVARRRIEIAGASAQRVDMQVSTRGRRHHEGRRPRLPRAVQRHPRGRVERRSEEHTSELQSLMRISYAVFCLKKKTKTTRI